MEFHAGRHAAFGRMNERLIRRLFPNASRSLLEANVELRSAEPGADSDKAPLDGPNAGEKESVGRVVVRFTCYRVRSLDFDNRAASCKDLLDGLRHAHLIRDDSDKFIEASVSEVKVGSYADEKTVIELIYP